MVVCKPSPVVVCKSDQHITNELLKQTTFPAQMAAILRGRSETMDAVNVATAMLHMGRFVKDYSVSSCEIKDFVATPQFGQLVTTMISKCKNDEFGVQSLANAWWGVAKLYAAGHIKGPVWQPTIITVLEAFGAMLEKRASELGPVGVSTIWYSIGAIAVNYGPTPSNKALDLLWKRTRDWAKAGGVDAHGISNIIMAIGQLCKMSKMSNNGKVKETDRFTFAVHVDALEELVALARRLLSTMTKQGIVCCTTGCSLMYPHTETVKAFMKGLVDTAAFRVEAELLLAGPKNQNHHHESFTTTEAMFTMVTAIRNVPYLLKYETTLKLMHGFRQLTAVMEGVMRPNCRWCDVARLTGELDAAIADIADITNALPPVSAVSAGVTSGVVDDAVVQPLVPGFGDVDLSLLLARWSAPMAAAAPLYAPAPVSSPAPPPPVPALPPVPSSARAQAILAQLQSPRFQALLLQQ